MITFRPALLLSATLLFVGGCASNGGAYDPLEPVNRGIYQFNDTFDKAVMKPAAKGYKAVVPSPVRTGVGNFFGNLGDVVVTANDVLQLKLGRAASDFTRVAFNTTFGVLGVFDVATGWGLPKHTADFGLTLGRWGVGNGPYLVLPFLGPSTLRDSAGLYADSYIDPVWNTDPVSARNSMVALDAVDTRARALGLERLVQEAALDPYVFVREAYLQRRRNQLYDGHPPRRNLEDEDQ